MSVGFLDLLFPKRCVSCGRLGNYICRECFSKIVFIEKPVCPICQRQAIGGRVHLGCRTKYGLDGLVVGCRYRGPVKLAIQKVKYRWVYDIGETLSTLLLENIWRFNLPGEVTLVPIPLHLRRKKWRGFNQAELLAKILAKSSGLFHSEILERITETKAQVGLDKKERKANVKGVFVLKPKANIRGKDLVLVDDVYTSGATMQEAARVLKQAGAGEVWGMTIALG